MLKLICVNADGYEGFLTKGKIYEGKENEMFYYDVSNDRSGNKDTYLKSTNEIEYIPAWTVFVRLDNLRAKQPVSYTHLTLPTILLV